MDRIATMNSDNYELWWWVRADVALGLGEGAALGNDSDKPALITHTHTHAGGGARTCADLTPALAATYCPISNKPVRTRSTRFLWVSEEPSQARRVAGSPATVCHQNIVFPHAGGQPAWGHCWNQGYYCRLGWYVDRGFFKGSHRYLCEHFNIVKHITLCV